MGSDFLNISGIDTGDFRGMDIGMKVAGTPMDHAGAGTGSTGGEIVLLQEDGFHPPQGQVPGDAGPIDPTADYGNLEIGGQYFSIREKSPFMITEASPSTRCPAPVDLASNYTE